MALGDELRVLRRAAYRTEQDVAATVGCDARTIVDIEDGRVNPSRAIFQALRNLYPALPASPLPPVTTVTVPTLNQHVVTDRRKMKPLRDAFLALGGLGISNRTRILSAVKLVKHGSWTDEEIDEAAGF